ncbi:MAG: hypothetical protein ACI4TF_16415 [Oliverpabstia sp.]
MKGKIVFTSSNEQLNKGFEWAKNQALQYSHEGDLVGDWYEAALPGRMSFCIRDVAHHAMGAEMLGLRGHTKNMLRKFVQNISKSKQYCTFWEMNKDYQPCPVDYASDEDFWYNLPANFELMDVCYKMYCQTGDMDYIVDEDFVRFYDWTIHKYAEWWDKDGDFLLERKYMNSRLGIPSYCEDDRFDNAEALIDMLVIEIQGYRSAAAIYKIREDFISAQICEYRAEILQRMLENEWWDEETGTFYQVKEKGGKLSHSPEMGHGLSLLYYNVIEDEKKRKSFTNALHDYSVQNRKAVNVESMSHYPILFFKQQENGKAYYWLKEMIRPDLPRREYPEVSYAAVESFICGVAGIHVNAPAKQVTILPAAIEEIEWFSVENCPMFDGEADILFKNNKVNFKNRTNMLIWVNGRQVMPNEMIEI